VSKPLQRRLIFILRKVAWLEVVLDKYGVAVTSLCTDGDLWAYMFTRCLRVIYKSWPVVYSVLSRQPNNAYLPQKLPPPIKKFDISILIFFRLIIYFDYGKVTSTLFSIL